MKASTVLVVVGVVALVVAVAPYLLGFGLLFGIVHHAGRWRREARQRADRDFYSEALRSVASCSTASQWPVYTGLNNPAAPAWFDR